MAKFMCPHCHSEHIQKCSIVYQNGASQITTSNGEEVRIIGEGLTQLAQQVAPPAKKETHWGAMVISGFLAVLLLTSGLFIVGVILGVIAFGLYGSSDEAAKFNKEEYPILYNQWCNSYICNRCGHTFFL